MGKYGLYNLYPDTSSPNCCCISTSSLTVPLLRVAYYTVLFMYVCYFTILFLGIFSPTLLTCFHTHLYFIIILLCMFSVCVTSKMFTLCSFIYSGQSFPKHLLPLLSLEDDPHLWRSSLNFDLHTSSKQRSG